MAPDDSAYHPLIQDDGEIEFKLSKDARTASSEPLSAEFKRTYNENLLREVDKARRDPD